MRKAVNDDNVVESDRLLETPGVPAIREVLPGFKAPPSWFGFFGAAGLPDSIALTLNTEIGKVLQIPEVSARIRAAYLNVLITPPERLRPFIEETADTVGT